MQNITIGRYQPGECTAVRVEHDDVGNEISTTTYDAYAGWIEGVRDDGTTWIMWLDACGSPELFWGERTADGAVTGDGVLLATGERI